METVSQILIGGYPNILFIMQILNMLVYPSTIAHGMNGLLILAAFIMIAFNWSYVKRLRPEIQIVLTLIFATAMGVHGISHRWLELKN